MSAAAGLFLVATATAGDATTGERLHADLDRRRGPRRHEPVRRARQRRRGIIGAFVTTMIVNILFFSNIDPLYQSFYEGLFLVIAVVAGGLIGRLLRRRAA